MGRKEGGWMCRFRGDGRRWVLIYHNVVRAEVYYLASGVFIHPSSRLATIYMGRKLGAVHLLGVGAGSPSNTMWLGPRPTCTPSFILIHPTVCPQYTDVTDRQDRTRQWSNSIGWAVLQTVAQKLNLKPTFNFKNCSCVCISLCTTQYRQSS